MKKDKNRLEKATAEFALAATAYMLNPTQEGRLELERKRMELASAQIEHQCECTRCLTVAMRKGRNRLVHGNDNPN
jgi:hypothetical protein